MLTVGELKELIKDIPDEYEVWAYEMDYEISPATIYIDKDMNRIIANPSI